MYVPRVGAGNANVCLYLCCQRNEEGFCLFFFLIYILQFTFIAIPHGIYDPLQEKTFLFEEINGNILQNIDWLLYTIDCPNFKGFRTFVKFKCF